MKVMLIGIRLKGAKTRIGNTCMVAVVKGLKQIHKRHDSQYPWLGEDEGPFPSFKLQTSYNHQRDWEGHLVTFSFNGTKETWRVDALQSCFGLENGSRSSHTNGNGLISWGSFGSSSQKAVFEKDFPPLGSGDRQCVPGLARVLSPGLSSKLACW
jgi:hypothetical protein